MGRPSLAERRRAQIIHALTECIRDRGYEATTLEAVAQRAGVKRALIRHYFGNREELLIAAIERLVESYRADYVALADRLPDQRRLPVLLRYLFGGNFNRRPAEDAVVDALLAASHKNPEAQASLRRMYRTFEDVVLGALLAARAGATRGQARSVAYAIMCLAEQNATLQRLGFESSGSRKARTAADALVRSLGTAGPRTARLSRKGAPR